MSIARTHTRLIPALGLFFLLVLGVCEAGDDHRAEAASGTPLLSGNAGVWQIVPLPEDWIARHWSGDPPARLYIALRPPHPDDLNEFGPCSDPPRLMVGISNAQGRIEEHLLACCHYCAPNDGENGKVYRDLFARHTILKGITAQLLDDGRIDIIEHYHRIGETPVAVQRDVTVVEKIRLDGKPRIRHRYYTAADLEAAIKRKDSQAPCLEQPYDPPY